MGGRRTSLPPLGKRIERSSSAGTTPYCAQNCFFESQSQSISQIDDIVVRQLFIWLHYNKHVHVQYARVAYPRRDFVPNFNNFQRGEKHFNRVSLLPNGPTLNKI